VLLLKSTTKNKGMAFKKGESGNPKGRTKGAPNKSTAEIKEIITRVVGNQLELLESDLTKIRKQSPARAAEIYMKMVDYVLPKQTKIDIEGEINHRVEKVVIEIKKTNDSKHSDNN
jgi:hypothetical protein